MQFSPIWIRRSIRALRLSLSITMKLFTARVTVCRLGNSAPVTADTSFYLGAISKAFTGMAIMLLAEYKKLSYDDRLSAFFPQLPSWSAEISVRHLLHHTIGLAGICPAIQHQ
jgi:CubicO group peptidase (beta-lactamase class C family)